MNASTFKFTTHPIGSFTCVDVDDVFCGCFIFDLRGGCWIITFLEAAEQIKALAEKWGVTVTVVVLRLHVEFGRFAEQSRLAVDNFNEC